MNSGPIVAVVRIQVGLRSMGVSALRASTRSSRRPSGAMVTRVSSVDAGVRRWPVRAASLVGPPSLRRSRGPPALRPA